MYQKNTTPQLRDIINHKEWEVFKSKLPEKKKIMRIIHDFVSTNRVIIYGGMALNTILPHDQKIYKDNHFPDYDCMSPSAKHHSIQLANQMYKEGFKYTEVRDAFHPGTYKVFVNFQAVADFTQVREKFFDSIYALSEEQARERKSAIVPHVAPIYLMKHHISKELSRPEGSLYRWNKIYERSKLLDKMVKYNDKSHIMNMPLITRNEYDKYINSILAYTMMFVRKNKYPIVGNMAIGIYHDHKFLDCCRLDDFFSIFEILSDDPLHTFEDLKTHIKPLLSNFGMSGKFIVSKRYFYKDILPKRLRVYLKIKGESKLVKLMTILHTEDDCVSIVSKHGYTLGSPYTILSYLYAYWLVYYVYEPPHIHHKVDTMIATMEKYLHTRSNPKERFSTSCYGNQKTPEQINQERWNKLNAVIYRPYQFRGATQVPS